MHGEGQGSTGKGGTTLPAIYVSRIMHLSAILEENGGGVQKGRERMTMGFDILRDTGLSECPT